MECVPCSDFKTMIRAWRKAMHWSDGLNTALACMLATVVSTRSVGDQLWMKFIGPASCGKSTLCEALSINEDYILAKSKIKGFHSGWREQGEQKDDDDASLVQQARNKTLVIKDADTLMQMGNIGEILSEMRDIYDCVSRSHYKNRAGKDYKGVRMTFILCGTSVLRKWDSADLGARFLDCVIMDTIDDDEEDEILWRVANRQERNMAMEADGKAETQYDPAMVEAMQLSGGYVAFLRENASALFAETSMSDTALRLCTRLGKFVAYMRARPSKVQDEHGEREFAARLTTQLTRLAKCLAVVLNKDTVDEEVMGIVRKVAMDTAHGSMLKIVQALRGKPHGMEVKAIGFATHYTEERVRTLLRFLKSLGVVELNESRTSDGRKIKILCWQLTDRIKRLCTEVFPDEEN